MDMEMSTRVRLGAKVPLVGQAKPFLLSGKSNFLSRFTLTFSKHFMDLSSYSVSVSVSVSVSQSPAIFRLLNKLIANYGYLIFLIN
jgi:hypothetical protein